jgi:hypothetical protein
VQEREGFLDVGHGCEPAHGERTVESSGGGCGATAEAGGPAADGRGCWSGSGKTKRRRPAATTLVFNGARDVQTGLTAMRRLTSASSEGHGRVRQGCVLNTSCDQQAALRLDAGMRTELVLRVYRPTAHCIERRGGSGCKEPPPLAHRRMNGVPSGGIVCWGQAGLSVIAWHRSHRRRLITASIQMPHSSRVARGNAFV